MTAAGPGRVRRHLHAEDVHRRAVRLLERLTDLIIPVEDGKPGALAAGCAAWIDMISSENDRLKSIYNTGFAWLDQAMKTRGAADFVSATPAQQTELLDVIAYRRNESPKRSRRASSSSNGCGA